MRALAYVWGLVTAFGRFAWRQKRWWLVPLVASCLLIAAALLLSSSSSPFLYTLF